MEGYILVKARKFRKFVTIAIIINKNLFFHSILLIFSITFGHFGFIFLIFF